jgi:transposase-like protein
MQRRRSAEQIQRLLEQYRRSGLSRRAFAERNRIGRSTLDYWRRKYDSPQLVEVTLEHKTTPANFTIVLANARRIETSGQFTDAELARLIRVAENA